MAEYAVSEAIANGTQEGPGGRPRTDANGNCACLCGSGLNHPRSTFLQGHDQRFVGQLATEVVIDGLTDVRVQQLQLPTEANGWDIQERITQVGNAVSKFFSPALASKFVSAAHRRWDKTVRDSQPDHAKRVSRKPKKSMVQQAAEANGLVEHPGTGETVDLQAAYNAPDPRTKDEQVTLGAPVRVKVGRWEYDATVHGMNQAGKITAVRYYDKNDKEFVKPEGKFRLI